MTILKSIGTSLILGILMIGCQSKTNTKESSSNSDQKEQAIEQTASVSIDAFFQAALNGDLATIETALKNNLSVDTLDHEKRTALMLAAYNGHHAIVRLLIEKGADVNRTDNNNRTALMFASTGPFAATVSELLNAGADPNIADNVEKWTAIMMAASEGQLEVLKLLEANGADLSMVDVDGESAYDFAKANGHQAVADYLKK